MNEQGEVEQRSKRQKKDKGGRFAALKRLKELKGSKHKYEIDEVDNVYDTVDESEYTKKVIGRQDDDWIVDDDGSGYVEDGREIFDDDMDSESIAIAKEKGRGSKRKKKAVSENAGKGNVAYMLSNMQSKKKVETKTEDDDVLGELLSEIDAPVASTSQSAKKRNSLLDEKLAVKDYMKSFNQSIKAKHTPLKVAENGKAVLKELHDNECVETEACEPDDVQIETPPPVKCAADKPKNKLLFTIEKPVKKPPVEVVEVMQEDMEEIEPKDVNMESPPLAKTAAKEPKSKLLFIIEKPVKKPVEAAEVMQEDIDFNLEGDDFDFNIGGVEKQTAKKQDQEMEEIDLQGGFKAQDITLEMEEEFDLSEFQTDDKDKALFRFYWWDAYEDMKRQPGVVLMFGKTFSDEQKKFVSCSLVIKNILRKIFLLPRPFYLDKFGNETDKPVTLNDVYEEFNEEIGSKLSVYKARKVTKSYCFDPTVPLESEYLEVRYEGFIDFSTKKYRTFSTVFGIGSSFLEIFLLDQKIKGPCWLNVANYEVSSNPMTYTAMEVRCSGPSDVTIMEKSNTISPPPLTVMAINIKFAVNPKNPGNEIAMISCLVNNRYYLDRKAPNPPFQEHFCIISKLSDQMLPMGLYDVILKYKTTRVQKMDSERALLNYFLAQFSKVDPDLIVGHDLSGYQFALLTDRLLEGKATNISRLSRIKRTYANIPKHQLEKMLFSGRLVCDIKISAKELISARSYDLDSLCVNILKVPEGQRVEIEPESMRSMYLSINDLFKTISLTMQDTSYILRIMYELNVIPLALQITNIAGNIMSRTLTGGRSERNEFLLLHAFHERDYIVPEKRVKKFDQEGSKRKKPTYSGGLVLEPKIGFYDKLILLMDFNSLYPSIIQEYNICFTTLSDGDGEIVLPDKNAPIGILPTEIRKLVESRREVKKLMKNPDLSADLYMQYHIRQMALKLTANSMYGCLGFANSRFFGKQLAALVTQKGRDILMNTKDIVQKLQYDVIYGDTDSIMINTNILDYEQVFKIGKNIKQEINKLYKQVELDIDGVFKYLLLLKKKKYAAVTLEKGKDGKLLQKQEHKGLDIVRRDFSQLAAQAGRFVLNQVLSDQNPDERIENIQNHLQKLKTDIEEDKVPLPLYVITKQLTKEPNLYPDKKSQPHVQIAIRNNQSKGRKFKAGDTVPYVICTDGTNNPHTQRAYLIDELRNTENLSIDCNYYLEQQIFPVISRLCEPIDGIDSYQISTCLGLKAINNIKKGQSSQVQQPSYENFKRAEVRFRNVEPFLFKCLACKCENKVDGLFRQRNFALDACSNFECNVRPVEYIDYICNQMTLTMRRYVEKYYVNELACEDPACTGAAVWVPQKFVMNYPVCEFCNNAIMFKTYTEDELYSQLLYFQHIFDVSGIEKKIDPVLESAYNSMKDTVDTVLKHSQYAIVTLNELFGGFGIKQFIQVDEQLDETQLQDGNEDEI